MATYTDKEGINDVDTTLAIYQKCKQRKGLGNFRGMLDMQQVTTMLLLMERTQII